MLTKCLAIALGLLCLLALTQATSPLEDILENGNLMVYLITQAGSLLDRPIGKLQVSTQTYQVATGTKAWYEATCLYRPNVLCMYLDESVHRRPVQEHTLRNKNTAVIAAQYFINKAMQPGSEDRFGFLLESFGYNVTSTGLDNPVGIARAAVEAVLQNALDDGMNRYGDHPDSLFPGRNYSDTTGYSPVNTATRLTFPNRWQPGMDLDQESLTYRSQAFMTPQAGNLTTFGRGVLDIHRKPYTAKYRWPQWHPHNQELFAMVDEVIQAQQELNDERKMIVEMWDNKLLGPSFIVSHVFGNQNMTLDDYIDASFLANQAAMDAIASSWKAKAEYDRVRPVSIIRHFLAEQDLIGLGAPGEGLQPIKGKEWRSYAYTDAHPEYPSGSTCFCFSLVSALRHKLGSDVLPEPFTASFPAGSSFREPGFIPTQDTVVGPFGTFSEVAQVCGESRVWGGVHFRDAIEEPVEPCTEIGRLVYERYSDLVSGVSKH